MKFDKLSDQEMLILTLWAAKSNYCKNPATEEEQKMQEITVQLGQEIATETINRLFKCTDEVHDLTDKGVCCKCGFDIAHEQLYKNPFLG